MLMVHISTTVVGKLLVCSIKFSSTLEIESLLHDLAE